MLLEMIMTHLSELEDVLKGNIWDLFLFIFYA